MVCLDMKNIIKLRETLGYSDCGWSSYTHIPVSIIHEMEEPLPEWKERYFVGDDEVYDYLRMYETLMIKRAIDKVNDWYTHEMYLEASAIYENAIQEFVREDDCIIF